MAIDAGFDLDVQLQRSAINRLLDGVLAMLFAKGQTRFPIQLPNVSLPFGLSIQFGTLELSITRGMITALRPAGATRQQIEADFVIELDATLTNLTVFGTNLTPPPGFALGGLVFDLRNVDLGIERTPQGIPHSLVLGIKGANLAGVSPTPTLINNLNQIPWPFGGTSPIPALFMTILNLVTQVLNVGFRVAAALVPHIPIFIKELVDAFAGLGIALRATGSPATDPPFLTAVADSAVLALDFQRASPPPTGNPAQLGDILLPGSNIAALAGEGVLNQAIAILFQKGIIPGSFKAGGFKFHVTSFDLALLSPASSPTNFLIPGPGGTFTKPGALQLRFELRGKRGKCWCKVKVKIRIKAVVRPYLEVSPPPAGSAHQASAIIKAHFEVQASVKISGFLVVLAELLLGPFLPLFLFLLSQVANLVIRHFLPFTFSTQVGAGGTKVTLTVSSATVAAFTTLAFDFNVAGGARGEAALDISRFTSFLLVDQPTFAALPPALQEKVDIKVDYAARSVTIDDREIRLAADVSR